jgi:hypothetical protein
MIQLPPETNGWGCTDPDCLQYQKALSDTKFNMVQAFEMPDTSFVIAKGIIDLEDYSDDETNNYVSSYYESMDALKNEYGADANRIIAECIFESLQPIDYAYRYPAENEAEAVKIVLEIITND